MKIVKQIALLILILILLPISVFAVNSNNKFGISLAQPNTDEFQNVKGLVNSNGGDWGYVTLIIQENDRNHDKWQDIFNHLREDHLIPIIRLATSPVGENWRRPDPKDAQSWVDFLDSLNWVVKNRYVILFNEPNHGSEWGGEVDPMSYAAVSLEFAKQLKAKNPDFYVMLAGFDASAPSEMPGLQDEETFLKDMLVDSVSEPFPSGFGSQKVDLHAAGSPVSSTPTNIFNYVDGWASHSYPNPGFAGSPYDTGRGTVRTYVWELGILNSLGVTKELPVFITETGWRRGSENTVANDFQTAFDQIWGPDKRVIAVTPFVFDYQGPPFLEFSWKKPGSNDFYQQYQTVESMTKSKGDPEQIEKGLITSQLPTELVVQSTYNFKINLSNLGQAVWDKDFGYQMDHSNPLEKNDPAQFLFDDLKDVSPFENKDVNFTIKTNEDLGQREEEIILKKDDRQIIPADIWRFNVLPLPHIDIETSFFPWGKGQGSDYEVQIFDEYDRLVYKKNNFIVKKGEGRLDNVQNVAIDELYRVVLLKPYHLPRQEYIVLRTDDNRTTFKSLLPFDFNNDGAFNFKDILSLFKIK